MNDQNNKELFKTRAWANSFVLKDDISIRICEAYNALGLLCVRVAENRLSPEVRGMFFENFVKMYFATKHSINVSKDEKTDIFEEFIEDMINGLQSVNPTRMINISDKYFRALKKAGFLELTTTKINKEHAWMESS